MINPNDHTAKALEYVAEHLQEWPEGADFVHVDGETIYHVKGGNAASISYISREQWAAARVLYRHWFPEKQPPSETACKVCGEEHDQYEPFPGICGEYESGNVNLDLARAIYRAGEEGTTIIGDQFIGPSLVQVDDDGRVTGIGPGIKYDTEKPMMDLIPPLMELEVAKVLTAGAIKYTTEIQIEPENLDREMLSWCTCGKTSKRQSATLSEGTQLKECVTPVTTRNTPRPDEQSATQTESFMPGGCADPATTSTSKTETQSTLKSKSAIQNGGQSSTETESWQTSGTTHPCPGPRAKTNCDHEKLCCRNSASPSMTRSESWSPRTTGAEFVAPIHRADLTLTTATRADNSEGSSATDATKALDCSEMISKALSEHLPICAVHSMNLTHQRGLIRAIRTGAHNWRQVPDLRRRYLAAAKRHINSLQQGKSHDDETGLHHAAHAVCCLMFLGEVELEENSHAV